jgi:hypothetical protein
VSDNKNTVKNPQSMRGSAARIPNRQPSNNFENSVVMFEEAKKSRKPPLVKQRLQGSSSREPTAGAGAVDQNMEAVNLLRANHQFQ